MTSLEYTNSIEGLVNDFVNGASDEKEFKVGILDVLTKARDDFFGKIPKPATKEMINFLLVNALRLLSKEQQRMLAKEISDRASEAGVQPEVIASERSSANGAVAEILVEHSADGIKDYNRDAFSKLKQQLLEKLKLLYNIKFDVKSKDTITVYLDEDPYFYKIKDRTIDITDKLYVTYWVADL